MRNVSILWLVCAAVGIPLLLVAPGLVLSMLFVVGVAVTVARRTPADGSVPPEADVAPEPGTRVLRRLPGGRPTEGSASARLALSKKTAAHVAPAAPTSSDALFGQAADKPIARTFVAGDGRGGLRPERPARIAQTPPQSGRPGGRWSLRHLLAKLHPKAYPYFRGLLGFMIAFGAILALKGGLKPSTGMLGNLHLLFPTLVLAVMISPMLVPIISHVAAAMRSLGLRRGPADLLVGVVLTAIYWVPSLMSVPSKGSAAIATAIAFAFGGAMGGFEFWRAEGYPEAKRSRAQVLGRFKDGFMQGLGR